MSATIVKFPASDRARTELRENLWRESCDGFFAAAEKLGYRRVNDEESGLIDLLRHTRREGQEVILTTAVAVRCAMALPGFEIPPMRSK